MLNQLNDIIAEVATQKGLDMPLIGEGHAGHCGGIFSLLKDPGGDEHTAGSGAQKSGFVDICNCDPTAKFCRDLYKRLGIPKAAITPWNAYGAYNEKPSSKARKDNLPLCQKLIDTVQPVAIVAQGCDAKKMASLLRFDGPVFCVPHPGLRSRNPNKNAANDIEAAFQDAYRLVKGELAWLTTYETQGSFPREVWRAYQWLGVRKARA